MVSNPEQAVRDLCLALPEVAEKQDWAITWQVRGKSFAQLADNVHGDRKLALQCKSTIDTQDALVQSDPERFFVPQFMGHNGWVALRIDISPVDWAQAASLIEEAWRTYAPKRVEQALAAGSLSGLVARLQDEEERVPTVIVRPREEERPGHAELEQIRAVCFALPESTEKEAWGSPTFRVRDKMYAHFIRNERGPGPPDIWVKAPAGAQDMLVSSDPERFFVPPYMGPSGWVGVRLGASIVDWDVVAAILTEGWKMTAPKKLVQQFGIIGIP